jgi:hypothetical protein
MHTIINECDLSQVSTRSIIAALDDPSLAQNATWAVLLRRLPGNLQLALRDELLGGNGLQSISGSGWPHPGSVVVCMAGPFSKFSRAAGNGLSFCKVGGPHYWKQELCADADGTVHLLIF